MNKRERKRRRRKRADQVDQAGRGRSPLALIIAALRKQEALDEAARGLARGESFSASMLRPPSSVTALDRVPKRGDNSQTE